MKVTFLGKYRIFVSYWLSVGYVVRPFLVIKETELTLTY